MNINGDISGISIEIVSFPINSVVIFHSYVKLPEGNTTYLTHRIHGAAIYGNMDPINIPQSC